MNFLNSLDTALGPMGWIAILGALAGVLAKVRLEVVRVEKSAEDNDDDEAV